MWPVCCVCSSTGGGDSHFAGFYDIFAEVRDKVRAFYFKLV